MAIEQVDVMEVSDVVLRMAEKYFDFNSCCAEPRTPRTPRAPDPGCEVRAVMACRQRCMDEELGKSWADPHGRGYLKGME